MWEIRLVCSLSSLSYPLINEPAYLAAKTREVKTKECYSHAESTRNPTLVDRISKPGRPLDQTKLHH